MELDDFGSELLPRKEYPPANGGPQCNLADIYLKSG